MPSVVDMNGDPVAADRLAQAKQQSAIDARRTARVREADAFKLLNFFSAVLPVDEPEFQTKFVVDRDGWIEEVIERLQAYRSEA